MMVLVGMVWKLAARCTRCVGVWEGNARRNGIILVYITGLWGFSGLDGLIQIDGRIEEIPKGLATVACYRIRVLA